MSDPGPGGSKWTERLTSSVLALLAVLLVIGIIGMFVLILFLARLMTAMGDSFPRPT